MSPVSPLPEEVQTRSDGPDIQVRVALCRGGGGERERGGERKGGEGDGSRHVIREDIPMHNTAEAFPNWTGNSGGKNTSIIVSLFFVCLFVVCQRIPALSLHREIGLEIKRGQPLYRFKLK